MFVFVLYLAPCLGYF
uniref:Uncharacterized protein n=1 Tax=Rhizophora mucronata TaxID=61149 RepID=A0A2P2NU09_RHIMU